MMYFRLNDKLKGNKHPGASFQAPGSGPVNFTD